MNLSSGDWAKIGLNGHKSVHCFKFQSVVTTFGIDVYLHGPGEGKRHDAGILCESGLLADLQQNMQHFPSGVYSLYGHITCWLFWGFHNYYWRGSV